MKDALQPAPQKDLVIGLEVDGNTLPHELWHILSGHERNEVAAVIANEEIKFYAVDRESSHPRKRTSSGNLWQQRQGRATESAVARLVAGAVEGSKHDEQVIHMACHLTLVGMSKEFDDLVICLHPWVTDTRWIGRHSPLAGGKISRQDSGGKENMCRMPLAEVIVNGSLSQPGTWNITWDHGE